ncbi:sigma-70 family RNA polymerase sigma factor [Oxalobacteraceae bacterium CAVE-383]|nr:sigma-70 family RNA polymerase sigma factor [Oxalobacteraceae bacterium CAVE-383]
MDNHDKARRFETVVMPHLNAAYSLARWLTRDHNDAEDVVQMAFLRAFRFFDTFRDGNVRAWLLTIVRRTYYTWLRDHRHEDDDVGFDELLHSDNDAIGGASPFDAGSNPETAAASRDTRRIVNQALEKLPRAYREVVVLKDIENMSYKEIAEVVEIPIGTVMSRLARGRKLLGDYLQPCIEGGANGLQ